MKAISPNRFSLDHLAFRNVLGCLGINVSFLHQFLHQILFPSSTLPLNEVLGFFHISRKTGAVEAKNRLHNDSVKLSAQNSNQCPSCYLKLES